MANASLLAFILYRTGVFAPLLLSCWSTHWWWDHNKIQINTTAQLLAHRSDGLTNSSYCILASASTANCYCYPEQFWVLLLVPALSIYKYLLLVFLHYCCCYVALVLVWIFLCLLYSFLLFILLVLHSSRAVAIGTVACWWWNVRDIIIFF